MTPFPTARATLEHDDEEVAAHPRSGALGPKEAIVEVPRIAASLAVPLA
jgi:hypothetical protein